MRFYSSSKSIILHFFNNYKVKQGRESVTSAQCHSATLRFTASGGPDQVCDDLTLKKKNVYNVAV